MGGISESHAKLPPPGRLFGGGGGISESPGSDVQRVVSNSSTLNEQNTEKQSAVNARNALKTTSKSWLTEMLIWQTDVSVWLNFKSC